MTVTVVSLKPKGAVTAAHFQTAPGGHHHPRLNAQGHFLQSPGPGSIRSPSLTEEDKASHKKRGNRAISRSADDSSASCGSRFGHLAQNPFAGSPYPHEILLEMSASRPGRGLGVGGLGDFALELPPQPSAIRKRRVNPAGSKFAAAPLGGDAPHSGGHVVSRAEPSTRLANRKRQRSPGTRRNGGREGATRSWGF